MEKVHAKYAICSDFERDFASLTFALATGVGKTRLMGAFITYLYTQKGVKNFFVVAPNTTIYEKLRKELGDPGSEKYVFKGISCFANELPQLITGDDYRSKNIRQGSAFSGVTICVFNIDKFNSEDTKMRSFNEILGKSFFSYLSNLNDLVVIMDESHHYHGAAGLKALNELKPVLGLELTATPLYTQNSKQVPFKNVVYEYSLAKAIADGYTRTPFAMTRSDVDFRNFGDEDIDKMMLIDGITHHEYIKTQLEVYAKNHNVKVVKPFMMVVCKDINHAKLVESFICSPEFKGGYYVTRTIEVDSKAKGAKADENTRLLLDVEKPDNPVEIVIHVNKLKEGWDVNNLYTIVPLRTAASKILREQMVGRGLRLPYGERTGDDVVDRVVLTAHDKFADIIREAEKGESIFKKQNIIHAEDLTQNTKVVSPQTKFNFDDDELNEKKDTYHFSNDEDTKNMLQVAEKLVKEKVAEVVQKGEEIDYDKDFMVPVVEHLTDSGFGEALAKNAEPFREYIPYVLETYKQQAVAKYIPIPVIEVVPKGEQHFVYDEFSLDLEKFNQVVVRDKLVMQNLTDGRDRQTLAVESTSYDNVNPQKLLVSVVRTFDEIDYEEVSDILFKCVNEVLAFYTEKYGDEGMRNIVTMNKREIGAELVRQILQHRRDEGDLHYEEIVNQLRPRNLQPNYGDCQRVDLYDEYDRAKVKSYIFTGIKKGVFEFAKFDSGSEVDLARILESDGDIINWLRPAPQEFNIKYGPEQRNYEPDFVIETKNTVYLTEVKADNEISNSDVLLKKRRGEKYCLLATEWGRKNGYKEWKYLFIPHSKITSGSSFANLVSRYTSDVDKSMVISERTDFTTPEIGDLVYNQTFGNGIIKKLENNIVSVDYNGLMKRYVYPDNFEDGILTLK